MDVRAALIGAHSAGDQGRLAELCSVHRDAIRRDFVAWTRVPDEVRADPAKVQRYAGTLINVAQFFATQWDEPALLDALRGPQETNPWPPGSARSARRSSS